MSHLASTLDRHIIPPPRPDEEMVAEFEAMLDPSSGRDCVLVTPGSRVPEEFAYDAVLLRVNVQPYGFIYTNNEALASKLRAHSSYNDFVNPELADKIIGEALFQAAGYNGIPEGADVYVSAYNQRGVQVSEVLANSRDLYALSVAEAVMRSHAGPEGHVEITLLDLDQSWDRCKTWYQRGGGVPITLALDAENFRSCESLESTKG
jgi:hypothetical protein